MGATNSTRKLTIDSIALLEMLEPNSAEAQAKALVCGRIQSILAEEWPTCRVLPFGSSESGLGFGGSDLDLGLYFDDLDVAYHSHLTANERIEMLATACTRLAGSFEILEFVQHARVPIVKLWDPHSHVACDLCVGSIHVLLNTALLKHYSQADPRIRPLAFAVKHWAKQRGINDSVNGTLSSYGYMLLLIFFLQSKRAHSLLPAVGSTFQSIQAETTTVSAVLHRLDTLTVHASGSTFGTAEHESVGALLACFFRFYATEFNYEEDVVSVRMGCTLPKSTTWSRPVPWRLSIEDPFELSHDVGRVIFSRRGQELLQREFMRAYELASSGHRLEEICASDETVWNSTASCYICLAGNHSARECSHGLARVDITKNAKADCWYCGQTGHVKATCPLYSFVAIPKPICAQDPPIAVPVVEAVPVTAVSSPVPIPNKAFGKNVWAVAAPTFSPQRAYTKKKKRPRRRSVSSVTSSPERTRKYFLSTGDCTRVRSKSSMRAVLPEIPCMS